MTVECPIAHTLVRNPVLVYTHAGDNAENCAARFNLDAVCQYIAVQLTGDNEVTCPNCQRKVDGILLDVLGVTGGEDEGYHLTALPGSDVHTLTKRMVREFDASSVVDGEPRTNQLTIERMRELHLEVITPPAEPVPAAPVEDEGAYCSDDCVKNAGIIAAIAALVMGIVATVQSIFGWGDEPEKIPANPQGSTTVSTGYLNDSPRAKV